MMGGPIDDLGVKCPENGEFYVCEGRASQFMGCCTINPCETEDGICPDDDLYQASFRADAFDLILPQDCVDTSGTTLWYTCSANDPPFMGCCDINACEKGSCPRDDLRAAKLSEKKENAAVFVSGPTTTSTTGIATTSATSSTQATSSATNPPSSDNGSSHSEGLSHGAVAGIAAGSAIGGLLVIGLLIFWLVRRFKRNQKSDLMYRPQVEYSPPSFHEAKLPSPFTPTSTGPRSVNSQHPQAYYHLHPQSQATSSPPHYVRTYSDSNGSPGFPTAPYGMTPSLPLLEEGTRETVELDASPPLNSRSSRGFGRESELYQHELDNLHRSRN